MTETIYSRDGCVFRPAGVVCEKGAGVACFGCGWHPRIEEARKEQVREKLRRRWKFAGGGATPSTASRSPSLKEGGKKGGGADV